MGQSVCFTDLTKEERTALLADNQTLEGHTVQHEVIIVNLTVGTIARGEIASFALNANNLIQHFLALFPLGLFSSFPSALSAVRQSYQTIKADDALLCALDRIFDDAEVFKIREESFRGKQLVTISFQTSRVKEFNPTEAEVK